MSKIIFICFNDHKQNPYSHRDIEILSKRLMPDNISPPSPLIINDNGVFIGILNPSESLPIKNASVCMGNLIDPKDDWWQPMAEVPDGSYALFRSDENAVELASDIVASRTIWYVLTENMFIASTSQRAIVFFLQDFIPNKAVYPWMLSSGTLGPELSWDNRVKCLGANARLLLNRSSWKLKTRKENVYFTPEALTEVEHEKKLKEALEYTFQHLKLDFKKWVLPLSGGYDSRAILLYLLRNQQNLKSMTWGLKSSLLDKNNDAYIAQSLAEYYKLEHAYLETDISSNEPIETIFNRFLVAGEGRIDNISGYMDGFRIWKHIYELGYQGIIRGDEAFGCFAVSTPRDVYMNMGLVIHTDYENLNQIRDILNEYDQKRPVFLEICENESLESWRDRVNAEFELPVVLAALNDLKLSYVEVINPLLSRRIIQQVRRMPDSLRTNKSLFKKIVRLMNPKIKFAKYAAIESLEDILKTESVVNLISNELNTAYDRALLSDKFIEFILDNIKLRYKRTPQRKQSLITFIKPFIPTSLRKALKKSFTKKHNEERQIDYNVLAFRAYMICKMNQILYSDTDALQNG